MMANMLIRSTAIITAPIFTRLLSPSDYGIASNFAAWLAIISVLTGLGLPYAIGVAKIDFPSELRKFVASIQTLGSIVALLFLIFGIIFSDQLVLIMHLDKELIVIIFVYLLFLPSVVFAQEKYKYELLYKENIIIALFSSLGAIVFCILLILYKFDDQRYLGRIIGLILPLFLMGLYFYYKNLKDGWSIDIKKYWRYALKISLPMIPHALAMIVLTQIDRIMIIKYVGNYEAGLYSFGFSYAVLLMIVSNAILQAYKPWLYLTYQKNKINKIQESHKVITSVLCFLTILIITIGPEVLFVLGTEEFFDAKWVILPIALGTLYQFVYNTYSSMELYHKKSKVIAIGSLLTAAINYLLNYTFIPIYGYYAAGYTTFISYLLLALFHLFAYKIVCGKKIFNDKFIWISTLSTSFLGFFIIFLYPYFYYRYSFLFLFFMLIFFTQKTQILKLFKLIKKQYTVN
jgi:O-antigen/teichoic acid export membrane protein